MSEKLYIILPCYNEEEILERSAERVREVLASLISDTSVPLSEESRILFVDDGSKDGTWDIIQRLNKEDAVFSGLKLARNYGHQTAIFAGMEEALKCKADCMVTIDADLQQDINALPEFLAKYRAGADIVYGIRDSRDTDGFFKKSSATMYYKLMNALGVRIIPQSADYRLMSARAVEALAEYKEHNLFIRGLVPEIGFNSDKVFFHVSKREAGSSKYTLKKMLSLALDGITSFSIQPLRLVFMFGIISFIVSLIMMALTIIDHVRGVTVPGWSTLTISIWLLGGVQLLSLGVLGEYIGRTYMETKRRPRYFVSSILGDGEDKT
ncbi:MAG: glycosyltransferase family 2 protein [Lachnospiraceae bacterium]|nr:glycosyltransferase family 2 protein [Lachnospiraceae bacterium]